MVGDLLAHGIDLLGELARRRHDEHARAAAHRHGAAAGALHARQRAHRGQQERGGLAGSGLRGGEQVAPCQHLGDGTRLDGRGVLVAEVLDGVEHLLGQAEVSEARSRLRRGGSVLQGLVVLRGFKSGCSHAVVPFWRSHIDEPRQGTTTRPQVGVVSQDKRAERTHRARADLPSRRRRRAREQIPPTVSIWSRTALRPCARQCAPKPHVCRHSSSFPHHFDILNTPRGYGCYSCVRQTSERRPSWLMNPSTSAA